MGLHYHDNQVESSTDGAVGTRPKQCQPPPVKAKAIASPGKIAIFMSCCIVIGVIVAAGLAFPAVHHWGVTRGGLVSLWMGVNVSAICFSLMEIHLWNTYGVLHTRYRGNEDDMDLQVHQRVIQMIHLSMVAMLVVLVYAVLCF